MVVVAVRLFGCCKVQAMMIIMVVVGVGDGCDGGSVTVA